MRDRRGQDLVDPASLFHEGTRRGDYVVLRLGANINRVDLFEIFIETNRRELRRLIVSGVAAGRLEIVEHDTARARGS